MACFYCARQQVKSADAGTCLQCRHNVCTDGLSARPFRFHGDTCACGCGELVCIYHMQNHATTQHSSSIQTCFANAALHVSLLAASAVEQAAGFPGADSSKIGGALKDVHEFIRVFQPDVKGITAANPMAEMQNIQTPDALRNLFARERPGFAYANLLAAITPAIVQSIQQSWIQLPPKHRARISDPFAQKLDNLAKIDLKELRALPGAEPSRAYSALSPRLGHLMQQFGKVDPDTTTAMLPNTKLRILSRKLGRTERGIQLPDTFKDKF